MVAMEVHPGFVADRSAELLAAARRYFRYLPGEKRATGRIAGALLLNAHHAVFQAYLDGTAGCDWHADDYFQSIVSLGATRTMGVRIDGREHLFPVSDGDLVILAAGIEHAILLDPEVTDERISLVFRTKEPQ